MKNCGAYEQPLALHASGVPDEAGRASLEEHLAGCERCRARLRQMCAVCESLAAVAESVTAELPPGFHARVGEAIAKRGARTAVPGWQWLAPLAAACVVAGLFFFGSQSPKPVNLPEPAAAVETPPPTLWVYERAMAGSDEALEKLMERQASSVLPPDPGSPHAFGPSSFQLIDL